jgi:hypothetical protein
MNQRAIAGIFTIGLGKAVSEKHRSGILNKNWHFGYFWQGKRFASIHFFILPFQSIK